MVVAPQTAAAEVARAVLRGGGNAVDAAVSAAFVQGVIDPFMCGIGGCGVALVRVPGADPVVVDFYARAGGAVREEQWEGLFIREAADRYGFVLEGWVNDCGHASVGVPGTVAGLDELLRRFGTISWDQALRPAIAQAAVGTPVTGNVRGYWVTDYGPDVVPNLKRIGWTPAARAIYTRDGEPYGLGELIPNPDLQRTLTRLAREGAQDFYRGQIAAAMVADFERHGGFISAADLAGYRAGTSAPVEGEYRGHRVLAAGPPAGGMTLLQMLNYLEGIDLAAAGWPSPEAALARVRAMEFAFADRERHLADPAYAPVPVEALLDKAYARAARELHESPNTTHLSIVDGQGMAVSMTHTLGASSGVVTPGLGFNFNNYLNCFDPRPGRANSLAPGKTRVTMMTPAMAFSGDRLAVVIGAPGGTKIVTGVLQALLNLLDHGMSPVEAVAAARLDFQADTVQVEQRITGDLVAALEAAGYRVQRRPLAYDGYFARVQCLAVGPDGAVAGGSDPRSDGGVALPV